MENTNRPGTVPDGPAVTAQPTGTSGEDPSRSSAKSLSAFWFWVLNSGVNFGANLIGGLVMVPMMGLLYTDGERKQVTDLADRVPEVLALLSYAIPSVLNFLYLWPIIVGLHRLPKGVPLSAVVLGRLLRMPRDCALLSLSGWAFGVLPLFVVPFLPGTIGGFGWNLLLNMAAVSVLQAFLLFVFVYFALDFLNRATLLPKVFRERSPFDLPGVGAYPLAGRFQLLFFSVAVYPIAFLTLYHGRLLRESQTVSSAGQAMVFAVCAVAVGWALTFFLARTTATPLAAMAQLARRVREGDFRPAVSVVSTDEVGQLGDALNGMTRGLAERERMREAFGQAVDPQVRDHLLARGEGTAGEVLTVSVLFVDIRGFTGVSEGRDPGAVLEWLNGYFELVQDAVERQGGFINKFVGDAALAVFGAPRPTADHAERALGCARTILAAVDGMARRPGFPELKVGIGMATGLAMAGLVGSSRRREYSVIGDTVNLASRIQNLCKETGCPLLFHDSLRGGLTDAARLATKEVGEYEIRGRKGREKVWTVGA